MGYICNLSPELQKKAREELNEDPARRDADIEHIRKWLQKQPHINARTDDWTILRFLRGCKFSLERTKEKLDMYYTCKTMIPEWFSNRDPQDKKIREILEMGQTLPLPGHDHYGRKVVICRFASHDPSKTPIDIVFKVNYMMLEILLQEDYMHTVCGLVAVIDFKGSTASHMLQLTPTVAKKSMTVGQVCNNLSMKMIAYAM